MTTPASTAIRTRLRRALLLRLSGILIVAGVGLYVFFRLALTAQFDQALIAKARSVAAGVEWDDLPDPDSPLEAAHLVFEFSGDALRAFEHRTDAAYFEVWRSPESRGALRQSLVRSLSLDGGELPQPSRDGKNPCIANQELPDGSTGRCVWLDFIPHRESDEGTHPPSSMTSPAPAPPPAARIAVANRRNALDQSLDLLALALLAAGALVAVGCTLAIRRTVQTGLAPAEDLAQAVSALRVDALPDRLESAPLPTELAPIGAQLDALLGRIRHSVDRERRFTGAAAHELRTPLAELAAILDVRSRWPDSMEACQASLREARAACSRMERLVESLLALARAQNPAMILKPEPTVLPRLLADAVKRAEPAAVARRLRMEATSADSPPVSTDPGILTAILDNLIGNAAAHTPEGGEIRASVLNAPSGRVCAIEIRNSPTNLSVDDLSHFFEPMWRKDTVRSAANGDGHHLGLGLSLARAMTMALGWEIRARLEGADLVLSLDVPE